MCRQCKWDSWRRWRCDSAISCFKHTAIALAQLWMCLFVCFTESSFQPDLKHRSKLILHMKYAALLTNPSSAYGICCFVDKPLFLEVSPVSEGIFRLGGKSVQGGALGSLEVTQVCAFVPASSHTHCCSGYWLSHLLSPALLMLLFCKRAFSKTLGFFQPPASALATPEISKVLWDADSG